MSAFEELKNRTGGTDGATPLEWCVVEMHKSHNPKRAEQAAAELAAKDAALAALRAEVEKYREIIADANELLWEFTENPNIEMGEVGHQKIEGYFKKYSSNNVKITRLPGPVDAYRPVLVIVEGASHE